MRLRRLRGQRLFKCICCIFFAFMFWTFVSYLFSFNDEDFPEDVAYDIFIDETKEDHVHIPLDQEILEELERIKQKKNNYADQVVDDPKDPIVLWWTEFTGEPGKTRRCGDQQCFFTNNRKYSSHKHMKVFMFYGTDFNDEDLPLPRSPDHIWALFHEESPKNNFLLCHEDVLTLFNYTSTFRRESDFPITTQHLISLDWLLQKTFDKTVSQKNSYQEEDGLASVIYVQSGCDPPSDRDEFVKLLMNYISVDSYGTCLKNKKLPEKISHPLGGMSHRDFYELISQYKFALSMENAVCEDYITEKLWRPLMVGTVPIVFGSSRVKDFLPSNNSALEVINFRSAEHLATYINYLNSKDSLYDNMRDWKSSGISNTYLKEIMEKRTWGPDNNGHWIPGQKNFIEDYECYVCEQIHETIKKVSLGEGQFTKWANHSHYGCPKPLKFNSLGKYAHEGNWLDFWSSQWERQRQKASSLRRCVSEGRCDRNKANL
ncbi:unnamed protein product [Lymnaea stagnalis]|uniref:Fucosyltransferase n=1 Tax=Lymnaea stagnalis TaxID=6523 RepID=A0AAV2H7U1_LYMST